MKNMLFNVQSLLIVLNKTSFSPINKTLRYIAFLPLAMMLGCQSTPPKTLTAPVIPKVDNTFDTSGKGSSKNLALADAMQNANVTCNNDTSLRVVVITHQVKYKGLFGEKADLLLNKIGSTIGNIAGKSIPSTNTETDYEASLHFKCVRK